MNNVSQALVYLSLAFTVATGSGCTSRLTQLGSLNSQGLSNGQTISSSTSPSTSPSTTISNTTTQVAVTPAKQIQKIIIRENGLASLQISSNFAAPNSAGNAIIVFATWTNGFSNLASVTDSLGNSYQEVGQALCNGPWGACTRFFVASNIKAGTNTLTLRVNSRAVYLGMQIFEYSGLAPVAVVDAAAGQIATASSAVASTPTITTSSANDLVMAGFADFAGNGAITPTVGWALENVDPNFFSGLEDLIFSSAGSIRAEAQLPVTNGSWVAQIVALKTSSSSSSSTPTAPAPAPAPATMPTPTPAPTPPPAPIASGQNHYVRAGASGLNTGTDWNNAWREFNQINWSKVLPGDTVWIAGGTYTTQMNVGASGTATSRILIKRVLATDAVPVAAAGWSTAFDSQVVVDVVPGHNGYGYRFLYGIGWNHNFGGAGIGSYVTLDGRVDSGIKIFQYDVPSQQNFGNYGLMIDTGNNVVMQYIEVAGPQVGAQPYPFYNDDAALQVYASPAWGLPPVSNLLVSHCRLHGNVQPVRLLGALNPIIEHTSLYDNGVCAASSTPGTLTCCTGTSCLPVQHNNVVISSSTAGVATFRYNNVWNWQTEGILIGNTAGEQPETWKVYGNIWHDPFIGGYSRIAEGQDNTHTLYFYNNTIVGAWQVITQSSFTAQSQSRNNIFWKSGGGTASIADSDYDFRDGANSEPHGISYGANPFVNLGFDFHIIGVIGSSYPRNKGVSLSSEYSTDYDGKTRGADGYWDIGAYEY